MRKHLNLFAVALALSVSLTVSLTARATELNLCADTIVAQVQGLTESEFEAAAKQIQETSNTTMFQSAPHERPFPRDLLRALWRKQEIFRQQAFYDAFQNDAALIESIFSYWYPEHVDQFEIFKSTLPPHLLALALDPGLKSRASDFLTFTKSYLASNANASAIELRSAFSKTLGTMKSYRALALKKSELDRILKNGLNARDRSFIEYEGGEHWPNVQGYETKIKDELNSWSHFIQTGPTYNIGERIYLGGVQFLHSITRHPEVAIFAASRFGASRSRIYVFELEIPVLEVITLKDIGLKVNPSEFSSMGKTFRVGDDGVEDFVFGNMPREWIVGLIYHRKNPAKTQTPTQSKD